MCVLFGPEVVLRNAFAAQRDAKPYIEIDALREFCDILHRKLTKADSGASKYKYVCFKLDQEDLEEFCEEDGRFISGIGRVYATKLVDRTICTHVNSAYAKEIRGFLDEAREEFAMGTKS